MGGAASDATCFGLHQWLRFGFAKCRWPLQFLPADINQLEQCAIIRWRGGNEMKRSCITESEV